MGIINSNTAARAAQLLMRYEGFINKPQWDVNAYRAGYGSDTVTRADGSVIRVVKGVPVSKEDAARDLARRIPQFANTVVGQVGQSSWQRLPDHVQAALLSVAYNYGGFSKLKGVRNAIQSGNIQNIANSISSLKGHNNGINSKRRLSEANYILTGARQGIPPPNQFGNNTPQSTFTPPKVMQGFDKLAAQASDFKPPQVQKGFDKLISADQTTQNAPEVATFEPPKVMQGFDKLLADQMPQQALQNTVGQAESEQAPPFTPPDTLQGFDKLVAQNALPVTANASSGQDTRQMVVPFATLIPQTQEQMGLGMPTINAQAIFPQILANATDLQNNRLAMA